MSQTIQQSYLSKTLLPQDAYWVRQSLQKAVTYSNSQGFCQSHFLSSAYALEAVLLSILNCPAYLLRGCTLFATDVLELNFSNAVIDFSNDLYASAQSFVIVAFGTFFVAAGILFPKTVFTLFDPIFVDNADRRPSSSILNSRRLNIEVQRLECENQSLQSARSTLEQENRNQASSLEGRRVENLQLQVSIEQAHQRNAELQLTLNQEIEQRQTLGNQALESLNQTRQELETIGARAQLLETECRLLQSRNEQYENTIGGLQQQLQGVPQRIQQAVAEVHTSLQENFQKERQQLQDELKQERERAVQLEEHTLLKNLEHAASNTAHEEIEDLKTQHQEEKDRLTREHQGAIQEKETALAEASKEIAALKRQIEEQEENEIGSSDLKTNNKKLVQDNEDLAKKYADLEKKHIELQVELDDKETQFKQKIQDLEKKHQENLKIFQSQLVQAEETTFNLVAQNKTLELANRQFKAANEELNLEKETLQAQILEAQNTNQGMQKAIKDLQQLYIDLQSKESQDKNTGILGGILFQVLGILDKGENKTILYSFSFGNQPSATLKFNLSKVEQVNEFVKTALSHAMVMSQKKEASVSISAPVSSETTLEDSLARSWISVSQTDAEPSLEVQKTSYLSSFLSWIVDTNHPSKLHKYRVVLNNYISSLQNEFGIDLESAYGKAQNLSDDALREKMVDLLGILKNPIDHKGRYVAARNQYELFVQSLRAIIVSDNYEAKKNKKELSKDEKWIIDTVRAICMVRWAHNEMFPYLKEITDITIEAYRKSKTGFAVPQLSEITLSEVIGKEMDAINGAPDSVRKPKLSLYKQMGLGAIGQADYTAHQNTPNVHGHAQYGDLNVVYLRHATPNVAGNLKMQLQAFLARNANWLIGSKFVEPETEEKAAPDYLEFIAALEERKEAVLFCSHQRLLDEQAVEHERDRIKEILKIQDSHHNFFAFVQNVDGAFFERTNGYAKISTFQSLKEKLIWAFYNPSESGCQLPKRLDKFQNDVSLILPENLQAMSPIVEEALKEQEALPSDGVLATFYRRIDSYEIPEEFNDEQKALLQQIRDYRRYKFDVLPRLLSDVHQIFFDKKLNIETVEEWQSFILAFYVLQKMDLKFRAAKWTDARTLYYATPCKDFLDRGGNMAFCEGRLHDYMLGQENDPEILQDRRINLEGPTIAVRKEGPIKMRVEPGLKLNQRLANLSHEKKEKLRNYMFEGKRPTSYTVEKPEGQTAIPTFSSAKTPGEVSTHLHALASSNNWNEEECTLVEKEGYEKQAVFRQIMRDFTGKLIYQIDDQQITKDQGAEHIYQYLTGQHRLPEQEALRIMDIAQQGLSGDLMVKLQNGIFKDSALQIKQDMMFHPILKLNFNGQNPEVSGRFRFNITCVDETNPLCSTKKPTNEDPDAYKSYGKIEGTIRQDINTKKTYWNWRIISIEE